MAHQHMLRQHNNVHHKLHIVVNQPTKLSWIMFTCKIYILRSPCRHSNERKSSTNVHHPSFMNWDTMYALHLSHTLFYSRPFHTYIQIYQCTIQTCRILKQLHKHHSECINAVLQKDSKNEIWNSSSSLSSISAIWLGLLYCHWQHWYLFPRGNCQGRHSAHRYPYGDGPINDLQTCPSML